MNAIHAGCAALLVAGLVLLGSTSGGAAAGTPSSASPLILAIHQSNYTTEQENFTVSLEVASTTNISFVYFTFCQLSAGVCYQPVAMAYQGGNWYSGTTNRMSSYNGMSVGVKAGYNITVLYDNNSTVTAPSLPNPFTNLSVAQSVSGEWMFEMTVSPTLYGLSGVVADAISSIGLAGVHLTLTPGNGTVAVTDATGAYAFVDLVNGSYTLTVSAAGYQSTNETVTIADANAVENVPLYTLSSSGPPHTSGGGNSGLPSLLLGAGLWVVVAIVVGTLALGAWMAWRRRKGSAAGSPGSSPDAPTSAAEADRTVGATSRRHVGWVVAILLVALVVGAGAAYAEHWNPLPKSGGANATMAPAFTLPSIYGENFTLAHYRNSSVVVVEFTSLSCSECQIVEKSLASLYSNYNGTGTTRVQFVSIYIEPSFGDTVPALQAYHAKNNITWTMARDTGSLAVSHEYGVQDIPTVFVIDPKGHLVYDVSGPQDQHSLQSTINSALAGTAQAISIVTVSVFALAAIAGVTTFFSPCAFPMFPGYMGLFLGLNTAQSGSETTGPSYKGAARRAILAGSVTAVGMIVVFLLVGVALIYAASTVSGDIPYLLILVGAVLIGLGALLLTNLQYWRIITPLQNLWYRLGGKRPEEAMAAASSSEGKGLYLKLFSYGMGYAAAAAGCVAPVIFSAIIAGLAVGLWGGIINVLIFSLTAAALMIVVTVMLALAGKKYVNQLKALTPLIKKISAIALIIVGVYLIYFYYTAWIV